MPPQYVEDLLNGSRRALARLLTRIENQHPDAPAIMAAVYPHTGRAWVVGVTGAPGTGKSSLVNALTLAARRRDLSVAVLAVDPTSPFSGGAILGDRIRMGDLSGDAGVFIRSMATRGSLGGLARAARDAVRLMDAAGFDLVLVETVGAGQSEVDIVRTADTTLVVEAPGLGDDVQAIKAGILEIADVLVVNKADRPGADSTVKALRAMLELGHPASRMKLVDHHGQMMRADLPEADADAALWVPPILRTVANLDPAEDASGIPALLDAIDQHRAYAQAAPDRAELLRQRARMELYERLQESLMARLLRGLPTDLFTTLLDEVAGRSLDPQAAVQRILDGQLAD